MLMINSEHTTIPMVRAQPWARNNPIPVSVSGTASMMFRKTIPTTIGPNTEDAESNAFINPLGPPLAIIQIRENNPPPIPMAINRIDRLLRCIAIAKPFYLFLDRTT